MGWQAFVAALVGSLAWPAAVVLLVLILREHLATLFGGTLRRLKVGPGGAELEWARAEAATAVAAVSSSQRRPLPDPTDELDEEFARIEEAADTLPAVAVQRAFATVERELRAVIQSRNLEPYPDATVEALIKAAQVGGAITKTTGDALRGLALLRNLAAHDISGTRTTPERARDFLVLARTVLYALTAERT